ncbi:MAG: hypothetical protein ACI4XL_12640 [Bacillus sp. (in: firmicutes)]
MRKRKYMLMLLLVLVLAACSSEEESKKEDTVNVDKGLLNVEVTLPASYFEDQDKKEIIKEAKNSGVKEVTENEDGSVTYKMSKSTHKEMLAEMATGIEETMDELETDEELSSIQKVEAKKDFTDFTFTINREEETGLEGFAMLGIAIQSLYYQLFSGVDEDDFKATFHLIDAETNEEYDQVVYPDDLEDSEDSSEENK